MLQKTRRARPGRPTSLVPSPQVTLVERYFAVSQGLLTFWTVRLTPPDARLDDGCEPLVEELVEGQDRSARDTAIVALLQLQIEKALRLAERAVDGLVVVFARPPLRIAPKVNPDEPGARYARN